MMNKMTKRAALLILSLALGTPASAWWDFGHRLTGEIAWAHLSEPVRQRLLEILSAHPRFEADFMAAMPEEIRNGSTARQQSWLLGRAAYWPDVARDLPAEERRRFNRSNWHYIDGALVRGAALEQGNSYIDLAPLPSRQALAAAAVRDEAQVDNVLVALDFNTALFNSPAASLAEKAVALCWILHLGGDIHQPLHTGTAFSPRALDEGDAGGNGVPMAQNLNLHALWDGGLAGGDYDQTLRGLLAAIASGGDGDYANADWSAWMAESRAILTSGVVYDAAIVAAIRRADATGEEIAPVRVGEDYLANRDRIAAQRLTLAGMRLANWLNRSNP